MEAFVSTCKIMPKSDLILKLLTVFANCFFGRGMVSPARLDDVDGRDASKRHVQLPHHPPVFLRGHFALCNEPNYFKAPPVFHPS